MVETTGKANQQQKTRSGAKAKAKENGGKGGRPPPQGVEALLARGVPDGELNARAVHGDALREIRRLNRRRLGVAEDVVHVPKQKGRFSYASLPQQHHLRARREPLNSRHSTLRRSGGRGLDDRATWRASVAASLRGLVKEGAP